MPWIVTASQVDRFAEFYQQLGQMLQAGLPLPKAIGTLRNASANRAFRRALTRVLEVLQRGESLSAGLAVTGRWLPGFDSALLAAGEQSGRLDECCLILSDYYRERAQMIREVISQMAYPMLIVFFAVAVFPPAQLRLLVWEGDVMGFLRPKLLLLGGIAGVLLVILYLGQGRRGERWRAIWESLLDPIPVLGRARRALALARTSLALESLLNAGVNVIQAWDLAAGASGSPRLRRAAVRACSDMQAGATPGEAIAGTGVFPEGFLSMYLSGEVSGRLDESLRYLRQRYHDEGRRRFKELAIWVPRLIYIGIVLLIGLFIIQFWTGYFDTLFGQF